MMENDLAAAAYVCLHSDLLKFCRREDVFPESVPPPCVSMTFLSQGSGTDPASSIAPDSMVKVRGSKRSALCRIGRTRRIRIRPAFQTSSPLHGVYDFPDHFRRSGSLEP